MKIQYSKIQVLRFALLSSVIGLASINASSSFASATGNNEKLDGVWTLSSVHCEGEDRAVKEINTELEGIFPSLVQETLIIDGNVGILMVNDVYNSRPGESTDPCNILVEGTVNVSDNDLTITPKYPISIGAGRCKIDSSVGHFLRRGNALVALGGESSGKCQETDFTFSKINNN